MYVYVLMYMHITLMFRMGYYCNDFLQHFDAIDFKKQEW
jgi:hypothetical protein